MSKNIELNLEQKIAFKTIDTFLKRRPEKIMVLEGYAGTGKSTVISHIFNLPEYSKMSVCMSATTNKAVNVLKKMGKGDNKKIDYLTIHKLLKIKRTIDSDGKQHFITSFNETTDSRNKKCKSIFSYNIIVIDEASMVDDIMYKNISRISQQIQGKIIFVGDRNQLPPVNQNISQVFNIDKNSIIRLKQIVRSKADNNIVHISNYIREAIYNSDNLKLKQFRDDHVMISREQKKWLNIYTKLLIEKGREEKSVILAYTNNKCLVINNFVRNILFSVEQTKNKFVPGEHIVFNNYYQTDNNKYYTSQNEIIKEISTSNYTTPSLDLQDIINLKNNLNGDTSKKTITKDRDSDEESNGDEEFLCQLCKEEEVDETCVTVCDHKLCIECIKGWITKHKCCPLCLTETRDDELLVKDYDKLNTIIDKIKYLLKNLSFSVYSIKLFNNDIIYALTETGKQQYSVLDEKLKGLMYEFKTEILKSKKIINFGLVLLSRIWLFVFNNVIDAFADINYGYCITAHKSQGSTYDNVFVDVSNILNFNRREIDGLKCLYTSVTRAANKLHLFY
tara:strand:+ start:450 stop:2135 length:1686 start_codon:yes stop_codon:yes gene_type:complete